MSKEGKSVFIDNEGDFTDLLNKEDKIIVLIYASWCPFCRNFLPVFEKYSDEGGLGFVRVQDDQERIGDKFAVDIFPTVLFFDKGKIAKRLDGEPGVGLSEKQLADFIKTCRG